MDVEMSLGLHGPLPDGVQAEDATGVIGEAQRALEDQAVSTGDDDFDHSVVIRCPDPVAAVEYFDAERRRAFRDLVVAHASAEIGLANGRIYLRDREMVSRLDDLESRLALLRRVAPAFDIREPARSGGARC